MASKLPKGANPIDKTKVRGRLKTLSPLDQNLRSLLVKDSTVRNDRDRENKTKPPLAKVKSISDIISNNIQASTDLRSVTHYIKRAEQIWATLLLKPNGDQRQLLIYDTESSDVKNGKLHELLIQKVENYFTSRYPIEETIPQIIKDVLFRTGSYVHVSLSHAALDHLINGMEVTVEGNESFKRSTTDVLRENFFDGNWNKARNVGYIRKDKPSTGDNFVGFESLFGGTKEREPEYNLVHPDLKWTFTDNPVVLKVNQLAGRLREERLRKIGGMEGLDDAINNNFVKQAGKRHKVNNNHVNMVSNKSLEEHLKELYPDRHYDKNETLSVRKGKFYTGSGRGMGIDTHWPSESAITVNLNGEIGKPFGVIFLVDPVTGEPLKTTSDVKFYQTAKGTGANEARPGMGSINEVIQHIREIANGGECNEDMSWMAEFASATLEKELNEGFLNGDLHKDVSVSLTEENKKLFLSRALRDQGVRAIFVPSEYVTYVAIDFSRLGSGRSLIDEAKLHITRLAVLDTADALAQMENSISHTLLEITPEAEDFDFRNTASMARDEYFANNPTLHDIIGYNNVSIDAILDRFKEQSLTIKVNPGDNKYSVAPDITASQMVREPLKSIDPSTRENLLNTVAGYLGLKRSWLEDTGEGNDFAIEALADQELLRNQTSEYSRIFSRYITDIMRKHMRVNEPLIGELLDVIKENKKLYDKPDQKTDLKDSVGAGKSGEATAVESKEDDEDLSDDDMTLIRLVLKDFLNTFYVALPTPAITDSLNKLEDKLEAVDKLVTSWVELGGGVKMMKKRAEEVGLDGEDAIECVKAVLLTEAFKRYNLPSPFEDILSSGKAGGLMNIIGKVTDLDGNVLEFLKQWHKGRKPNDKKAAALQEKVAKDGLEPDAPSDEFVPGEEVPIDQQSPEETEFEETQEEINDNEETEPSTEETEVELGDSLKKTGDDLWS